MASRSSAPENTTIRCEATTVSISGHLIVRLPEAASRALPSRGQVAVNGTVDDQPFEVVVEPDGWRGHWIKLADMAPSPRDIREGQVVTLTLTPASAWPEPEVPEDLRSALKAAPDIADVWKSITPMARWEWVRWVGATKNPATRAKRVDVSISKMRNGKRRPCCFDLSSCTVPDLAKSGKLVAPD